MKKMVIIFIFLFLLTSCNDKDDSNVVKPGDALIIVQKNDVYGLINASGNTKVPLQYDDIQYCGSYFIVREDDTYGILNTSGMEVLPLGDYQIVDAELFCPSEIIPLDEDILIPFKSDTSLYGYVNFKGERVIPAQFDEAVGFFDTDLAPIKYEGLWGYINKDGEVLISETFEYAYLFNSNGLAAVSIDGKFGMIDTAGEIVIEARYTDMGEQFTNGLIPVELYGKYGFIDKDGEVIVEIVYESVREFKNGFAVVEYEEKFGYVNTSGEIVIDVKYDQARDFNEGLAPVTKDGLTGYINTDGVIMIGYEYLYVSEFIDGYATVMTTDFFEGVIDKSGEFLIPLSNQEVTTLINNMFLIKDGDYYGYANKDGDITIGFEFDIAYPFEDNGLAKVGLDGKFGLVDKSGNFIAPLEYDNILIRK